jgi:hypothetical protein
LRVEWKERTEKKGQEKERKEEGVADGTFQSPLERGINTTKKGLEPPLPHHSPHPAPTLRSPRLTACLSLCHSILI